MPTLVSPQVNDHLLGRGATPAQTGWWGHFGLQPTGQTLIRESGVWTAISNPTHTRLEAADDIRDTEGQLVKGYFLGGYTATITQATADEITAANLGATIT